MNLKTNAVVTLKNAAPWAVIGAVLVGLIANAEATRVLLCHYREDAGESLRTIVVSADAVDAHLGHGDALGACEPCGRHALSIGTACRASPMRSVPDPDC